jgi:acetolactate synthase I/II/III large subunit
MPRLKGADPSSSWIPGYSWNIPPTKLVHVDIDPSEIGRNYRVELGILADAKIPRRTSI